MRFQRYSKRTAAALSIAMGSIAAPGCGGSDPGPTVTFEVPKDARPEEITPGKPARPPAYRKSSGLPGPPPFNPTAGAASPK